MKRFTTLYSELDQTTRTNEKVAALEKYFREAPPADAAWALLFLSGRTLPRAIPTKSLWEWTAAETDLPPWLIEECRNAVGDTAETIALLLRNSGGDAPLPLADMIGQRLLPLKNLPEHARRELLVRTWSELGQNERYVWNKIITGSFRIGVARTLVIRALAHVAGIDPAVMAHRIMGAWKPTADDFRRMLSDEAGEAEVAKPYPFFLASPLELKVGQGENLEKLGPRNDWLIEWKWDGIRAQLIRRGGETLVWSRGDEMVSDAFPELIEAGKRCAPNGRLVLFRQQLRRRRRSYGGNVPAARHLCRTSVYGAVESGRRRPDLGRADQFLQYLRGRRRHRRPDRGDRECVGHG